MVHANSHFFNCLRTIWVKTCSFQDKNCYDITIKNEQYIHNDILIIILQDSGERKENLIKRDTNRIVSNYKWLLYRSDKLAIVQKGWWPVVACLYRSLSIYMYMFTSNLNANYFVILISSKNKFAIFPWWRPEFCDGNTTLNNVMQMSWKHICLVFDCVYKCIRRMFMANICLWKMFHCTNGTSIKINNENVPFYN